MRNNPTQIYEEILAEYHYLIERPPIPSESYALLRDRLKKLHILYPKFIKQQLLLDHKKNKKHSLDLLVEFIRADGELIYEDLSLLETLFSIAIQLLRDPNVDPTQINWLFIKQVFDTGFHQGNDWDVSDREVFDFFTKLSLEVLDQRFYILDENAHSDFQNCIYFIIMADGVFEEDKKTFLKIWDSIQYYLQQLQDDDDHFEDWNETYQRLF